MNIDWVIPCRYVEVHDNLGTIVGAGIDTFWVAELPATLQVLLAVRVLAMAEELEAGGKHKVLNRVRNPQGDRLLSEVEGELTVSSESANQDWLTGIIFPTVVEFEATDEGTYMIEHMIDDVSSSLPIHVVHGPPPGVELPSNE